MSGSTRVHLEIALEPTCSMRKQDIKKNVYSLLLQFNNIIPGTHVTPSDYPSESSLHGQVRYIQLCESRHQSGIILHPATIDYVYHIFTPDRASAAPDLGPDGEETSSSTHWSLPCEEFVGLWESLVFELNVKDQLLNFVETAAHYADKGVNTKIINWNRVVLLHGPPGTGKTSLCKALAQKLSIRLDGRYRRTQLVEINSHSLFSKWFSESGKLVMKMFDRIREIAEDTDALVCVLIDEVESLTHARKAAMNGVEPSDSIRVVNAVLTQIDQIQRYPNVLTLTTSNMTGAIDLAFVDRADIKMFIGLPSTQAVYQIFLTCLNELMDKGIIIREHLFNFGILERCNFTQNDGTDCSMKLLVIAERARGMSGRSLRKIPFLAHSLYLEDNVVTLDQFLNAMKLAIEQREEVTADDECLETEIKKSLNIENGH